MIFIWKIAANGILIGLCCACGSTMGMPMVAVGFMELRHFLIAYFDEFCGVGLVFGGR
jgi:hypothetical protein